MTQQWWYDAQPLDSALSSVVFFLFFVAIICGLVCFSYVTFPVEEAPTALREPMVRISLAEYTKYIQDSNQQNHVASKT